MIRLFFSLILLFQAGTLRPQLQQVTVSSPLPGEALQGQVEVIGNTRLEGFVSYEVSFAYQQDPTNTWFLLYQGSEAVEDNGVLVRWDTTTISDGTYRLRVVVYLEGGRAVQTVISGLRVRNYSPVETSTPAPAGTPVVAVTQTPQDYQPTNSAADLLVKNPAEVGKKDLNSSLAVGGLLALGVFVLLGIYLAIRGLFRRL